MAYTSLTNIQGDQRREVVFCIVALAGVIVSGTVGFVLIEQDWTVWRALYFTLVTITTVGYGDEGLSEVGQVFAAFLLLVGIAIATYSLSTLVRFAITSQLLWRNKIMKYIEGLSGHYVVCGFGRIGKTVCDELQREGISFVVIEADEHKAEEAAKAGYPVITGNSIEDETLNQAGADRAAGIICVVNSDAENVFIALSAREFNPDAFIACRASTEQAAHKMKRAGANLVVSPYTTAGSNIACAIARPNLARVFERGLVSDTGFSLSEVKIEEGSKIAGQTIKQCGIEQPDVVFVAIQPNNGELKLRPGGDELFHAGDVVIVAGQPTDVNRMKVMSSEAGEVAI